MYLICDFDGTLVKNDYFAEQISVALIKNPFKTTINILTKPILQLKHQYLDNFKPQSVSHLMNEEVISLLKQEKSNFTKTILITASTDTFIKNALMDSVLFDEVHGSQDINLKKSEKLNFIKKMNFEPFVYIGDSKDDEILFEHAAYYYKICNNKPILHRK